VNKTVAENPEAVDIIDLNITLEEPQIIIGERGQTLFETQRLLRAILTKKIQKIFYLNLDINGYKQSKIEYLKKTAKELADEVFLTKEEKALPPMSAYERRIIHAELSSREDITTESQGEGEDRHIVIKPK
jgi:spoIIIJ-associated protein